MSLSKNVYKQFIDPNAKNRDEIEKSISEITDQLLDFFSTASQKPTYPDFNIVNPDRFRVRDIFASENQIRLAIQELLDQSMNPANPTYIGHMDSIPTLWSILGDYVASALNNNMLSLEMSPILTQLEYALTKQFAAFFELPESSGGVMLSGGTLANLQALMIARNIKLEIHDGNLTLLKKEAVIFTSEHAHSSIQKIGMMIGIGAGNIIKINADQNSKMNPRHLEFQIAEQKKQNKIPIAVVATAGTTVSGNIDPIEEISKIATRHNLWLHVDAIYGGAVILSRKYKNLIKGIDKADSVSFNPQKWMYVAKTCSMVLFRDFDAMTRVFRTSAPYMKAQSDFINLGEISIQGSKHAEVIKLWLSLLGLGIHGYEELINYSFELTEYFTEELSKRKYLKLVSSPELNLICFRGEPTYIENKDFDTWNEKLQHYLMKETNFFLSLPKYKGDLWLRVVLLNPFTTTDHIKSLFEYIDRFEEMNK